MENYYQMENKFCSITNYPRYISVADVTQPIISTTTIPFGPISRIANKAQLLLSTEPTTTTFDVAAKYFMLCTNQWKLPSSPATTSQQQQQQPGNYLWRATCLFVVVVDARK